MTKILDLLHTIEKDYGVEVLFACETGSRAWGFPSPDSDFDIRFIYKHPLDWYLSLKEKKDSFELMLEDGNLDVSGWDIKKGLTLLSKGNAALIERFTSPIIYFEKSSFKADFTELIQKNYNRMAVFHHHFSLARNFWDEQRNGQHMKLKALFYLIRSILSCKHALLSSNIVPMNIFDLMEVVNEPINSKLLELIKLKSKQPEHFLFMPDYDLINWIDKSMEKLNNAQGTLPHPIKDYESLDNFFKKTIQC